MVTSVTYTTADTTATSSTSSSSQALSANYDMFLQLLTAQMKYQDPLDPTDTNEFTSQLVEYSNLEQQISTNDKLDEIMGSLNTFSMSSGVGYVGHVVETEGSTLTVGEAGTPDADWVYDLDGTAASVTLSITDEDGNEVWSGTGETASGRHTLDWDGTDSSGNPVDAGVYSLSVTATAGSGAAVASTISISGTVTGVSTVDGTTVVEIGSTAIALPAITRLAS